MYFAFFGFTCSFFLFEYGAMWTRRAWKNRKLAAIDKKIAEAKKLEMSKSGLVTMKQTTYKRKLQLVITTMYIFVQTLVTHSRAKRVTTISLSAAWRTRLSTKSKIKSRTCWLGSV